ncbi:MAG TPA: methionine--tRNA ligase [Polyangiaceae bacterium]|nr:methionine--tRNA ligase [Polyangiaceae bacterium]
MSRFYVTTPIYYVNDVPHLGTSYTTIACDAIRRYHLLRGDDTRMLTGTDEHGMKIERVAQEKGMAPAAFVKDMSDRFEAVWPKLEVQPDDFIRTTQPRHEKLVQELWTIIEKKGDLYLGAYEGWYCVECEDFKTEKDLVQPGNVCPIHKRPTEWLKEDTYFFKLSKYEKPLLDYYEKHPEFVQPETRRNEVASFVRGGLKDLSVSRTSFTWGVPVPGNPKHVMYVWFDALANYWSAVQSPPELQRYWDDGKVVHLVGKDIVRFHAIYWPAFLMAAGLPLPTTVYAHGFLTFNGQKMSKSLRNAVDPVAIARGFGSVCGGDEAGADVLRYQLLRAIAFGQDGDFDLSQMIERYNADLGKNLGNLLARTLGLCAKMTDGKVPEAPIDEALRKPVLGEWHAVLEQWNALAPHRALEATWAIASLANQYVDRAAPWAEDKKGNKERVNQILSTLLSVLEALSRLIWPVIPKKSDEMRMQLGLQPIKVGGDLLTPFLEPVQAGTPLAPASPLFPTLDADGSKALLAKLTPHVENANGNATATATATATTTTTTTMPPPFAATTTSISTMPPPFAATSTLTALPTTAASPITYDQFAAVDLRVGIVRTCERVPKKDKLLRLTVDVGEPEPRTIIAGLALSFPPESLVGRRVVVVANLAPRDFGKGLVSHGMLLATGPSEKLALATVPDVEPGAKLK